MPKHDRILLGLLYIKEFGSMYTFFLCCTGPSRMSAEHHPKQTDGHGRYAEHHTPETTATPEGRQSLFDSLWEGQWNSTLASLVAGVIFIVLLVAMITMVMDPLQPFLEGGARADLALEGPGWQLCPQLIDDIEKTDGVIATLDDLIKGISMSCTTPSEESPHTWPLGPHLLANLAASALLGCGEVSAFCYGLEDMNKAAYLGKTITKFWVHEHHAQGFQMCADIAVFMSERHLRFETEFLELHDMLWFKDGKVMVARLNSGDDGMAYVFDGTGQNKHLDPLWLLQCALEPILKSQDVVTTLQNLSHGPFSADIRNCLSSPLFTVKINIVRSENWRTFSCFHGIISQSVVSQSWTDFQTAVEVRKLQYRSQYFSITYENLLACYTGLLGGVIAGLVLLCGNVIYQIILASCRRRKVSPCYACLACTKFSDYPLLSQGLAPNTINAPSGRYQSAV